MSRKIEREVHGLRQKVKKSKRDIILVPGEDPTKRRATASEKERYGPLGVENGKISDAKHREVPWARFQLEKSIFKINNTK